MKTRVIALLVVGAVVAVALFAWLARSPAASFQAPTFSAARGSSTPKQVPVSTQSSSANDRHATVGAGTVTASTGSPANVTRNPGASQRRAADDFPEAMTLRPGLREIAYTNADNAFREEFLKKNPKTRPLTERVKDFIARAQGGDDEAAVALNQIRLECLQYSTAFSTTKEPSQEVKRGFGICNAIPASDTDLIPGLVARAALNGNPLARYHIINSFSYPASFYANHPADLELVRAAFLDSANYFSQLSTTGYERLSLAYETGGVLPRDLYRSYVYTHAASLVAGRPTGTQVTSPTVLSRRASLTPAQIAAAEAEGARLAVTCCGRSG
jgi:hypothetical protein